MALPLIPVAAVVAQGAAHVLTKPWPWVFVIAFFIVSKFNFGVFAQEVSNTIWSLWWVVVLIIAGLIANSSLKIALTQRGQTQRYRIKEENRNK